MTRARTRERGKKQKLPRGVDDEDEDEDVREFLLWCQRHHIYVNDEDVTIESHASARLANESALETDEHARHRCVRAKKDLAPGVVVFVIPKNTVVCARNSSSSTAIRSASLGGGLALNASALAERAKAIADERRGMKEGKFGGYFKILPRRGERTLPMFWGEDLRRELRGTELERHLREDDEAFKEDYEQYIAPIVEAHAKVFPKELCDIEAFKIVASIAASRAFYGAFGAKVFSLGDRGLTDARANSRRLVR